jgi:hypothetical protein
MASFATPYGLRAIQAIGGRPFSGGTIREYKVSANNAAAIFNGDLVVLSSAGQPSAVAATPTPATAGIVGVCVGARYVSAEGQPTENHFLPANLVTGGATEVFVKVMDDPAALFRVKGTAALGTFNSGTAGSGFAGAIGKNAELGFATAGSTSTGNSGVNLIVGTNGAGLLTTNTFAVRIVGIADETQLDAFPEFIVKLNVGVHSYETALGV